MGVDLGAVRKKYRQIKRGSNIWRPEKGKSFLKFVPFLHYGKEFLYVQSGQHFGLRPNSKAPFECMFGLAGVPCPCEDAIEEVLSKALDESRELDDDELQVVKDLTHKPVFYFNIVDWKSQDSGVQVFPCPPGLASEILGLIQDEEVYPDFFDWNGGFIIIIENDPSQGPKRYSVKVQPDRVKADPDLMKEAKDLFAFIKGPDYDWVKAVLEEPENYDNDDFPKAKYRSIVELVGEPWGSNPDFWEEYGVDEEEAEEMRKVADSSTSGAARAASVSTSSNGGSKSKTKSKSKGKKSVKMADLVKQQKETAPVEADDAPFSQRVPLISEDDELPSCCGTPDNEGLYSSEAEECGKCIASEICQSNTPPEEDEESESNPLDRLKQMRNK